MLFYCPEISPIITLDTEESRHAVRVLRLRGGDPVQATDGRGLMANCVVAEPNDKGCVLTVESTTLLPPPAPGLTLAVAPTKNPARMEWLVEKAVEVGVSRMALVQGDHSERAHLKTDRLQRIAVSAMKQSLRAYIPTFAEPATVRQFIASTRGEDSLRLIAHCEASQPRTPLADALLPGRDAVVLIGPEGDFSAEEIALALECGYRPVSLGPARLRTETAALYAVAAFNLFN